MSKAEFYYDVKGEGEHILALPDTRQMAYAQNRPPDTRIVALFFTGAPSVGSAVQVPTPCQKLSVHWVAPTLPNTGGSSPGKKSNSYHAFQLSEGVNALLSLLYHTWDFDHLYMADICFGTVPAQLLYGASYEMFPYG
ncbi:hypothetical protein PDE_09606 [Penicillium oxalicum 114-2]|uniref:Uncharacterized protein n=1 Tax=Penicillium oxalicum (strain 114-2 / CGMCC 5302) TaxID=933388 RepID=S8BHI0_PENO1|nr:hypothetical protein PDE_09606 [Penicillium oxalicum 114-2]